MSAVRGGAGTAGTPGGGGCVGRHFVLPLFASFPLGRPRGGGRPPYSGDGDAEEW